MVWGNTVAPLLTALWFPLIREIRGSMPLPFPFGDFGFSARGRLSLFAPCGRATLTDRAIAPTRDVTERVGERGRHS